mgnify:CR=1 FL=1
MDNHTFAGFRQLCLTYVLEFTDYQGIGQDPLYRRYDSVESVVRRGNIPQQFRRFLARPLHDPDKGEIRWYVPDWNDEEVPVPLTTLQGPELEKYRAIRKRTVDAWMQSLDTLSGEDLQIMMGALKHISDDFIFCSGDEVYLVGWGMNPSPSYQGRGAVLHNCPRPRPRKPAGPLSPETPPGGGDVVKEILPPPPPPEPPMARLRFLPGDPTAEVQPELAEQMRPLGYVLNPGDIPGVHPPQGATFVGWNPNPVGWQVNGDMDFLPVYESMTTVVKPIRKGHPWWWWLLWILLGLLLLLLAGWLFRGCLFSACSSCAGMIGAENGVIALPTDDRGDCNGVAVPITGADGKLPSDPIVAAPVRGADGEMPPLIEEPGMPTRIANRLILFPTGQNPDVDALARDFKQAYPGDAYNIIGVDRNVPYLVIEVPQDERERISAEINGKIPSQEFIAFDEELYELNGQADTQNDAGGSASVSDAGWHLRAIRAPEAWQITRGNRDVVVAVVDDGIQPGHPMFKGRIVKPYNVFTHNNQLSAGSGHGTHTAGLAVGSDEFYASKGAAGVAPDCSLMPVQVFDNGQCPLSALVSGVMYAVNNGASVINMSVGPSLSALAILPPSAQRELARTQFLNTQKLWNKVAESAVKKNVVLVMAAGNDNILSILPPENRNNLSIAVGAVDRRKYPTEFTNWGDGTDLSAPGVDIMSSFPTGDFRAFDGTSQAAPLVAGAVALMKSLDRSVTARQARDVLYRTGCDVYGAMPPMIQVDLALKGVRGRDFQRGADRPMPPVPEGQGYVNPGAVWGDGSGASGTQPVAGAGNVAPGGGDVAVLPGNGSVAPVGGSAAAGTVTPGNGGVATPGNGSVSGPGNGGAAPAGGTVTPGNGTDYDEIRRQIEYYKKRIAELERQLPHK